MKASKFAEGAEGLHPEPGIIGRVNIQPLRKNRVRMDMPG